MTHTLGQQKQIISLVRLCMRTLKKKEYELNLPNGCIQEAIDCLIVTNKATGRSFAGSKVISINVGSLQYRFDHHIEYDSFNNDPVIGKIRVSGKDDHLLCIVAHEVAHHVQFKFWNRSKILSTKNWRKPHGEVFKLLYRHLRKDLVNPIINQNTSLQKAA